MSDIKHTFTGGKMNKDVDIRFVPQGDYRHAENIQVRTTEGDSSGEGSSGSVQNIRSTKILGSVNFDGFINPDYNCVGSIADEKNDKAYFLFRGPNPVSIVGENKAPIVFADIIAEYNVSNSLDLEPVLVDVKGYWSSVADLVDTASSGPIYSSIFVSSSEGLYDAIRVTSADSIRIGMVVTPLGISFNGAPNVFVKDIITSSSGVVNILLSVPQSLTTATLPDLGSVLFSMPQKDRLLNFQSNETISAINIIDNLLFFTDNENEPKKINIPRCKEGTTSFSSHTKIMVKDPRDSDDIVDVADVEFIGVSDTSFLNNDLLIDNVTVIRKPPKTPPSIHVTKREEIDLNVPVDFVPTDSMLTDGGIGDILTLQNNAFIETNYNVGDVLKMQSQEDEFLSLTVTFMSYTSPLSIDDIDESEEDSFSTNAPVVSVLTPTDTIQVSLVSINILTGGGLDTTDDEWIVSFDFENDINQKKLFELKFPRFAYRYKYDDGECSSFSPFSDVAFFPGDFDYDVKKGFNLGMTNHAFEFVIKDFIPIYTHRDLDVSAVDILVKTTDDANVYILKTIKRGIDPEWELFTTGEDISGFTLQPTFKTGELTLTSEMIHSVLPGNQLLRAWDNVPIKARAQELTASRLLFANYTQGYDLKNSVSLTQSIVSENTPSLSNPERSVKTNRSYKWGLVFGDKYGRETPVLDSSYIIGDETTGFKSITGDTVVPQTLCAFKNRFVMRQDWNDPSQQDTANRPDSWIDYVKYYVKETSSEYYNLILDRWYYAKEEENIWLSFDTSDRNKIDDETYLYLKGQHGTTKPVIENDARYKVIAIENEAPTFIKTENRILGDIKLTSAETGVVGAEESNPPSLLLTARSINIPGDNDSSAGAATIGSFLNQYNIEEAKGQLAFRIIGKMMNGTTVASEHRIHKIVPVNSVQWNGSALNTYVSWQDPLGNEVNYADHLVDVIAANPSQTLEYHIEFIEQIEVNKPEFDGRFFVLIEKDKSIVSNIESQSVPTGLFTYVDTSISFEIAYLASLQNNPGVNGAYASYEFDNDGVIEQFGGSVEINAGHLGVGCGNGNFGEAALGGGVNTSPNTANFIQTVRSGGLDDNLFMDGFRFRRASSIYAGDLSALGSMYNNLTSTSGNEYYGGGINFARPRALSQGGADTGTLGRMVLSQMIATDDIDGFTGTALSNLAHFEEGQAFKFDGDPSRIYKVIACHTFSGGAIRNHSTNVPSAMFDPDAFCASFNVVGQNSYSPLCIGTSFNHCLPCYSNNFGTGSCNDACFRATRVVDFRRIDTDTNNITNEGVLVSSFDPRGQLKHDGINVNSDSNRRIKLIKVALAEVQGSVVVPSVNKAIFETEPKESVDLDIYYEASHAIPMTLNENNYAAYIPHDCEIKLERFINNRFQTPIISELSEENNQLVVIPKFNPFVSNVGTSSRGNPVVALRGYENENSTGATSLLKHGIFPNDQLNFIHKNNLKTKSKILRHIEPTGLEAEIFSVTVENITALGQFSFYSGSGVTINEDDNIGFVNYNSNSGIETGMQLVNAYIPESFAESLTNLAVLFPVLVPVIEIITSVVVQLGGFDTPLDIPSNVYIVNVTDEYSALLSDTTWMAAPEPELAIPFVLELVKPTGYYEIDKETWRYPIDLNWHNCYAFGNGLESDRIRDDFNAPQLNSGVKASTTTTEYGEENRSSGIIYSGIYNSRSSVNNLSEFNMSEKITKDLNPVYGSIQALKTRDTDVVVFAEDKVLKVLAQKDALFNADGKPQLTASDKVLGTAIPFVGDYGISKNPESLASDQYRMYFADKQRGAILRLSRDGLTPISNVGMKSWFRNNLRLTSKILGTFDAVNGEYNVSLTIPAYPNIKTISFNEATKGWVSFKSYRPSSGVSISGKYLTSFKASVYENNASLTSRNIFYDDEQPNASVLEVMFNDMPSTIKSFTSIDYEGTQARISIDNSDSEYYNLQEKSGWYVDAIYTDIESGSTYDFVNKENKWFSKICGENNIFDTSHFAIQGLGFAISTPILIEQVSEDDNNTSEDNNDGNEVNVDTQVPINLTIQNNPEH